MPSTRSRTALALGIPILVAMAFLNPAFGAGAAPSGGGTSSTSNGVPQSIDHLQNTVDVGFADVQTSLTNGFNAVQTSLTNGFTTSHNEHVDIDGDVAAHGTLTSSQHAAQDTAIAGVQSSVNGVQASVNALTTTVNGIDARLANVEDLVDHYTVTSEWFSGGRLAGSPGSWDTDVLLSVSYKGQPVLGIPGSAWSFDIFSYPAPTATPQCYPSDVNVGQVGTGGLYKMTIEMVHDEGNPCEWHAGGYVARLSLVNDGKVHHTWLTMVIPPASTSSTDGDAALASASSAPVVPNLSGLDTEELDQLAPDA